MATTKKTEKYIEAVGRRKTSVARVRITPTTKAGFVINDRALAEYFPTAELQETAHSARRAAEISETFSVSAKIHGGGIASQAGALRHGIARALVVFKPELRAKLKKAGYLKRDPRMKERRKFGLKKARRAPQWSKR